MNQREAFRALATRKPKKLSEVEAAIGSLDRDVTSREAFYIHRKGLFGFQFVSVAFVGHRLRDDADPAIIQIELRMPEAKPPVIDLRALAVEVLGTGVDKEDSWPD